MHGKTGDVVLKVNGAQLAVFHDDAVIVEDEAAALHVPAGALDIVAADGHMAVLAPEGNLHDLKTAAHKGGDGLFVQLPAQQSGELRRVLRGSLRVAAVHAHVLEFQSQH